MKRKLLYYWECQIDYLIKNNDPKLIELLDDWLNYKNVLSDAAIEHILDNVDKLSDEMTNEFIDILEKYDKIEYALLIIRKLIEQEKKGAF